MARSKEFDEEHALASAMGLFWRQGYENTSLEDLMKEMGIARQSLYDTFGDKPGQGARNQGCQGRYQLALRVACGDHHADHRSSPIRLPLYHGAQRLRPTTYSKICGSDLLFLICSHVRAI